MSQELAPEPSGHVLPPPQQHFGDTEGRDENIRPAPTLMNARTAVHRLGLNCWHDLFSDKKYVGGYALNTNVGGQLTDEMVTAVRVKIRDVFRFDPGKNHTWDAINLAAVEHAVHPVRKYLERCYETREPWEAAGIDNMLTHYFGAPDTPFVHAVSRMVMVASVRRIFEPGCKFDYMTVLESAEGTNKSSGLATLYGQQWFTDQKFLGLDDKRLYEVLRGYWCAECGDLAGMKRAEVEDVKAQISRQADRVRPAYGRAVIEVPRQNVFWGSTNDREYLRSQTGNRRFLPIPVRRIDVEGLARDRDALWADAMAANATGESILLPESLWAIAGAEQDKRTMHEVWNDSVRHVSDSARSYMKLMADHPLREPESAAALGVVYQDDGENERVTSAYVLAKVIGIPVAQQTPEHAKRVGRAMRANGWRGPEALWIGGRAAKGYERDAVAEPREICRRKFLFRENP